MNPDTGRMHPAMTEEEAKKSRERLEEILAKRQEAISRPPPR
jgi:hypothetical protein